MTATDLNLVADLDRLITGRAPGERLTDAELLEVLALVDSATATAQARLARRRAGAGRFGYRPAAVRLQCERLADLARLRELVVREIELVPA